MNESDPADGETHPYQDPTRIVVIAYLLALTGMLVPLALLGGLFAGAALLQRNRRTDGIGVILVAVAATAFGLVVLR